MTAETSLVPTWPELVIPTLHVLEPGESIQRRSIFDAVAARIQLSSEAQAELLKSGGSRFEQRLGWTLSHMYRANWVTRPERGFYRITETGHEALKVHAAGMDFSSAHKIFSPFWADDSANETPSAPAIEIEEISDPIETIESAVARIEHTVGQELLERLRGSHPDFFEQAVVDLLLKMGYGGAAQRGRRIGGSNDEGVDGLIDQDALGLDQVYIQAKRYKEGNNVGREAIQAFVGALHGFGATRGVFLTTSSFTHGAVSYAEKIPSRIVLIDGTRLVDLMITYRVGVQEKQRFSAVEVDEDYFE
ncbi:restriction endonuclease [Leucobacter salsicius]|uniref:restriction endonuclease n=1 Tax=Leucobacter salsicius TaxID=664638 RepID=UPI000478030C|nr:restriction endonuclease [Leucobacter salsicius]